MPWDQFVAARPPEETKRRARRGDLALRGRRRAPPAGRQRRSAPGQLPLPPRRQRSTFLDFGLVSGSGPRRVGAAGAEPGRDRPAPRPRAARHRDGARPLPRARARAGPRPGVRLRLESVPAVPGRRVHLHPSVEDTPHPRPDRRSQRPSRLRDRQAQHAGELRHPRSGGVGDRQAILGKLNVTAPWRAMLLEYRTGAPPATQLGADEAAWRERVVER